MAAHAPAHKRGFSVLRVHVDHPHTSENVGYSWMITSIVDPVAVDTCMRYQIYSVLVSFRQNAKPLTRKNESHQDVTHGAHRRLVPGSWLKSRGCRKSVITITDPAVTPGIAGGPM